MTNIKTLILILFPLAFVSCEAFDYSPHEIILDEDEKNIIEKGINHVQQNALKDDTIIFAMTGDTQMRLDEVHEYVAFTNNIGNVDFTLLCGDLSNYGLAEEFKWLNDELKKLNHPYIPVIGNHDFIANGPNIFKAMYGPFDYSFKVGNVKFIAINTNSMEFGFDGSVPNIDWLESELNDSNKNTKNFVFSHVMPWNDAFDSNLEKPFADALAKGNVEVSFHGHNHNAGYSMPYNDGVRYIITGTTGNRSFVLVKIWNDGNEIEIKRTYF
jgi:predicted phosphodiesterase